MQLKRRLHPEMMVLWCLSTADTWLSVTQIQEKAFHRFRKKIHARTIRIAILHIDFATAEIAEQVFRCGSRRTYITHYSLTNKNLKHEFLKQTGPEGNL